MFRSFVVAFAAITLFVAADQRAAAQVIIINPRDPIKEREEFMTKMVGEWHQLYLGRKPNEKEQAATMQKLRTGTNAIVVQATLIGGDEFYKKNGGNVDGFIQGVFNSVLGRKATAAEIVMLKAQVNGFGRYKFAVDFLTKIQMPNPF